MIFVKHIYFVFHMKIFLKDFMVSFALYIYDLLSLNNTNFIIY